MQSRSEDLALAGHGNEQKWVRQVGYPPCLARCGKRAASFVPGGRKRRGDRDRSRLPVEDPEGRGRGWRSPTRASLTIARTSEDGSCSRTSRLRRGRWGEGPSCWAWRARLRTWADPEVSPRAAAGVAKLRKEERLRVGTLVRTIGATAGVDGGARAVQANNTNKYTKYAPLADNMKKKNNQNKHT